MRVLMLNYEFPPLGGGAANATFNILREFANYSGLNIDLVTSSSDFYKEEDFSPNIKIYFLDIGKSPLNMHFQSIADILRYAFKSYFFCKKLIKKHDYSLCHAFFGFPCGFIAMMLGLPYIVSLRGSDVPFYNKRFYWHDKFFLARLARKVWGKASYVVANSSGLKKLAIKNYPGQKVEVIFNGVDTNNFFPLRKGSERLRVLSVARLIERKGLGYLIKAVSELDKNAITLTIAGDGNLLSKLKNMVKDLNMEKNVIFAGRVSPSNMKDVYNSNDVFVLASLNEGMSNALLEAMASGMPVIVTDTGGTDELVNGNGFIVGKADYRGLKDALVKFMDNRSLISSMGLQSRKIAEKMSWGSAAISYFKLYGNICAE